MAITFIDIIIAIIIGIPFGLLFPVRPKYLILDLAAAIIFFPTITLTRIMEGTFTGQLSGAGFLYIIFLVSAFIATKFNRTAQAKEAIIKQIEHQVKE